MSDMGPRAVKWRTMGIAITLSTGRANVELRGLSRLTASSPKYRSFDVPPFKPFERPSSSRADSHQKVGFLTQKSCVRKRLAISDGADGLRSRIQKGLPERSVSQVLAGVLCSP